MKNKLVFMLLIYSFWAQAAEFLDAIFLPSTLQEVRNDATLDAQTFLNIHDTMKLGLLDCMLQPGKKEADLLDAVKENDLQKLRKLFVPTKSGEEAFYTAAPYTAETFFDALDQQDEKAIEYGIRLIKEGRADFCIAGDPSLLEQAIKEQKRQLIKDQLVSKIPAVDAADQIKGAILGAALGDALGQVRRSIFPARLASLYPRGITSLDRLDFSECTIRYVNLQSIRYVQLTEKMVFMGSILLMLSKADVDKLTEWDLVSVLRNVVQIIDNSYYKDNANESYRNFLLIPQSKPLVKPGAEGLPVVIALALSANKHHLHDIKTIAAQTHTHENVLLISYLLFQALHSLMKDKHKNPVVLIDELMKLCDTQDSSPPTTFEISNIFNWQLNMRDRLNAVRWAAQQNISIKEIRANTFSTDGTDCDDAFLLALYFFLRNPNNLQKALYEAVNWYGHTSNVAMLVGALVGSRTGWKSFEQFGFNIERLQDHKELAALADAIGAMKDIK